MLHDLYRDANEASPLPKKTTNVTKSNPPALQTLELNTFLENIALRSNQGAEPDFLLLLLNYFYTTLK